MKKILYVLTIIIIFLITPKVHAGEMIFGSNGSLKLYNGSTTYLTISQSTNNLPKIIRVGGSATLNTGVIDLELSPASGNIDVLNNNYRYLVFDVCANLHFHFNISNSSCTGSCLATGSYRDIDLGTSCTADDVTGTRRLVQVDIQKWYLNEVAEMLEASSYMTITNEGTYTDRIVFNQVFLSDEDYTIVYKNQQELINKLDSVQTAITNMQNSINSNANTNTQNIINNQNTNQAQNHQDSVNTQNKIDDLNDSITDDTVNSNTGKSFFDNFSDNTHGLSGIITAPLNIIQQLINVNPTSCSALSTTYHNKTISMECGKIFWGHTGFSEFNVFYNMVVGGAFCYLIIKDLFLTIEKLKDPDNDKVEVMDL